MRPRITLAISLIFACAPRASAQEEENLTRKWTLYVVPYSHLDVGFTQSQAKVLAKQKNNLRIALDLIDQTNDWPEGSKFKYLIETSWPAIEFMKDPAVAQSDKDRLVNALLAGRMEMGAFYINHQNRFLDGEALLRSVSLTKDAFKEPFGVPIDTAIIDDVCDGSGVLNILTQHRVKYFMLGCNVSHWALPPLFYMEAPGVFRDKLLVYLPPFIGGYNGAFDLSLVTPLPFDPNAAIPKYEPKIYEFLEAMEQRGVAPLAERAFDYRGQTIDYPYDALLVPYPSPHGPDNGEQDLTISEIARDWNARHGNPRIVVSTPREFFEHIENGFRKEIPVLEGELGGWWGEQIFWDLLQTDPRKESMSRDVFRMADSIGPLLAMVDPSTSDTARETLREAYSKILLNTDHNPAPVPFGNTPYTEDDVRIWKETRRNGMEEAWQSVRDLSAKLSSTPPSADTAAISLPSAQGGDKDTCEISLGDGDATVADGELLVHFSVHPFGVTRIEHRATGETLLESAEGTPLFQYGTLTRPEAGPMAGGPLNGIGGPPTYHRSTSNESLEALKAPPECGLRSTLAAEGGFALQRTIRVVPSVTRIELTAEFTAPSPQSAEHVFSFRLPIGSPSDLTVDGPYRVYHYGASDPLGWYPVPLRGDLFATLDFIHPAPTINATNDIFQWIRGIPRSLVARSFVEVVAGSNRITYSPFDSGVIIPYPYRVDPVGPESVSGFDHVCLGSTTWGNLGLGADLGGLHLCRATLQINTAALPNGPALFVTDPESPPLSLDARHTIVRLIPETDSDRPVVRLFQAGPLEQVSVKMASRFAARSAARATPSGVPRCRLPFNVAGGELRLDLAENELATLVFTQEDFAGLPACPGRTEGSCECETVGAPVTSAWGILVSCLPLAAFWFARRRRYWGRAGD
ncbi:MAG: hypothetical protein HYT87_15640 [Nitrospirae bacterium]|nr:hypothetical protein [Nitrospirota bacterium]